MLVQKLMNAADNQAGVQVRDELVVLICDAIDAALDKMVMAILREYRLESCELAQPAAAARRT